MFTEEREAALAQSLGEWLDGFMARPAQRPGLLPILVWPWAESPEWLRDIGSLGGDEDWIALIPPAHQGPACWVSWFDSGGGNFGEVSRFRFADGWIMLVGLHS